MRLNEIKFSLFSSRLLKLGMKYVQTYIFLRVSKIKELSVQTVQNEMESNLSAARFFSRKVESDLDCCRRVCRAPEVKEERELIKESSARFRLPRLTNKRFALSFRQSKKIGRFAIIASWGGSLPPSIFVFPSSRFRQQFLCIMFISTVHRALHLASRVRYLSPPDPIQSIHPSNSTFFTFTFETASKLKWTLG